MRITSYSTNYMNFGNIRPQNTLQKKVNAIVQDINQRTDVQLENKKREEHNVVARGMKEIVKKKGDEENAAHTALSDSLAGAGNGAVDWRDLENWQRQLANTSDVLEILKNCASMIERYEYLAAGHESSEAEEKGYWNHALQSLKEQLDKEFENMETHLQELHDTHFTPEEVKETLELDSFDTMSYKEIMESLTHAQDILKSYGVCNINNPELFSDLWNLKSDFNVVGMFEYHAISKIDGYLEYGYISRYDTEHYVAPVIPTDTENMPCMELSDILGMEPGQWLNTQA